jgi:hypothetical protein
MIKVNRKNVDVGSIKKIKITKDKFVKEKESAKQIHTILYLGIVFNLYIFCMFVFPFTNPKFDYIKKSNVQKHKKSSA